MPPQPEPSVARPAGGIAVPARERDARPPPAGARARRSRRRTPWLRPTGGPAATRTRGEPLERVLADCRAVLGSRDPDTFVVEGNLAVTHICLAHFERGLDLLLGNVEARSAVLGDTHPHTMVARHALAVAHHRADRLPEALSAFASVAAQRTRILGPAHPDTLVSRIGLAAARATTPATPPGRVSVLTAALTDAEQSVGSLDGLTIEDPRPPRARACGARLAGPGP